MSEHQLRIVVLVKQVPDTANVTGDAMKDDGTVNRAALPAIFNPEDLNALEEALRLKRRHGGRVTVLTMGPPAAAQVLRESLYRGADEVVLLSDRAFAGADTLATSYALARAIEQLGAMRPRALRPAGDRRRHRPGGSADRREAQPAADHLCEPHRRARAARRGALGEPARSPPPARSKTAPRRCARRCPPCSRSQSEANEPRPPSAKLVMTYKHAVAEAMPGYDDSYLDPDSDEAEVCLLSRDGTPVCRAKIVLWDAASIGAERDLVGLRGSPTRVKKIDSVVLTAGETRLVEPTDQGVRGLVRELIEEHILG